MNEDSSIERDIKAAGADGAPRITPDDIEANIASAHYFTAGEGVAGEASLRHRVVVVGDSSPPVALSLLTFCVLVLRNGFTVTGQSACASPQNFNAEIGRNIARADAVRQVWPLMGYELRSKLASRATYGVGSRSDEVLAVQPARARTLLPQYRSHKVVEAAKILHFESAPSDQDRRHAGGDWLLYLEAVEMPVCVGHDGYFAKHKPQVGGYYVRYEDGYESYSPAAAFESGYTLLPCNVQPHQQRVIAEKAELDERLAKLRAFTETGVYRTLPQNERNRLSEQASYMQQYSNVLGERIAAFG